jgi:hypothetical protein
MRQTAATGHHKDATPSLTVNKGPGFGSKEILFIHILSVSTPSAVAGSHMDAISA